MAKTTFLLVDDDRTQRSLSAQLLMQYVPGRTEEAQDGMEALNRLNHPQKPDIHMVLLDLAMPRMDGRATLNRIRRTHPALPVIMLSGTADIEDAVALMRDGATDFIVKPLQPNRVRAVVNRYLQKSESKDAGGLMTDSGFSQIIGAQGGLEHAVHLARKVAASDIAVLITGASGTGKELLARAIHRESARRHKPFVALNCGAIPEPLAESILFGHAKGAFTGAIRREIGKFREAEGGTLFLDEVGELRPELQAKLLRVIQEREVQPVGAGAAHPVNLRIVSATNKCLTQEVRQGRFREDLYYRLHVFPIAIAPLRERSGDIAALATHLLTRFCLSERRMPVSCTPAAIRWLCAQSWPGNVRQLENTLYRAAILSDSAVLDISDFTAEVTSGITRSIATPLAIPLTDTAGNPKTRRAIEAEAISLTLQQCGNNIAEAAHMLGMGQSTLYKRLSALKER